MEQKDLYYDKLKRDIQANNLNIAIPDKEDAKFRHLFLTAMLEKLTFDGLATTKDDKYDEVRSKYENDELTFDRLCVDYLFKLGYNTTKTLLWGDVALCLKQLNE